MYQKDPQSENLLSEHISFKLENTQIIPSPNYNKGTTIWLNTGLNWISLFIM